MLYCSCLLMQLFLGHTLVGDEDEYSGDEPGHYTCHSFLKVLNVENDNCL